MNRRGLLGCIPAAALVSSRAVRAQPLPVISDVAPPRVSPGPLWSGAPLGASLSLSFMGPGTLDPRVTFARASTATYFDAIGTMQTATTNTPRWDYDPATYTLRGLLIEEQRTNLVSSSANFGAPWGLGATTITSGQSGAPDGTASFTRLVETATTASHYITAAFPGLTASAVHTLTVYARMQQTRYLQLVLDDGGAPNGFYATFDLQAGTISGPQTVVGAGTVVFSTIQAVGGGTYRCSISGTIGAATTGRAIYALNNIPNPGWIQPYAGNAANGSLIWGAQLEVGAFPTSYVPTTAAAVTRPQDVCGIPAANMSFFVSPGGSWFAEFVRLNMVAGDYRIVAQPVQGSMAPLYNQNASVLGTYDGNAFLVTANSITTGVVNKGASTWGANAGKLCLNGGAVVSGAMLNGFAPLAAGGVGFLTTSPTAGSADNMSGYLRSVRYWPRVLSNAELQSVTR